ncbi:uncharacterized protein [Arachis hypogaea]|uniref:uncharacterized protein isoform X3 n=1 Tax=Arachis hypogaea TaxID=3818 RepID=UPI000DEC5EE4|nr:uncharacterized protein LOC112711279 isoform X2 [Arachis hypogaea]
MPTIELYVEYEQYMGLDAVGKKVNMDELEDIDWEEYKFEVNYEVDDENNDGDEADNPAVQNEADALVNQHPFGVSSFMRTLDLAAMLVPVKVMLRWKMVNLVSE